MSRRHGLLHGIFFFIDNVLTARDIRKDPERRPKSMKFGASSIGLSIAAPLLALLMAVYPIMMQSIAGLLFIFGIAIFAVAIAGTIICVLTGLLHWILQLSINRRAISWVALGMWIVSTAVTAFIAIWALSLF